MNPTREPRIRVVVAFLVVCVAVLILVCISMGFALEELKQGDQINTRHVIEAEQEIKTLRRDLGEIAQEEWNNEQRIEALEASSD